MIRIFEDLPVDAGFTCKPADGKVYRADLLKKAPVVRLSLVHGSSVAVIRSVDPAGAPGFRADMDEDFLDVYDADGAVTDLPGVYHKELLLIIESQGVGSVFYTIDGSDPTEKSNLYTGGILLRPGIFTVKTMFVNRYGLRSNIVTGTYQILDD